MTTATLTHPGATPLNRITRVVKLHLANPWTTIIWPWLIVAAILVGTMGIWLIVRSNTAPSDQADVTEGLQFSGASSWIFIYMLVVAVQAVNLSFPLALGYGSTRRDFYLGSSLTFVALSAMWAVGLGLLAQLETVTNGWGLEGKIFTAIYFGGDETGFWDRMLIFFCGMLFFFFVGAVFASVYVRWKAAGLILTFIALAAVLIGLIALVTYTRTWDSVGGFFVNAQATGVALWLLVPTAIAGVVGYLILRRATPRS